MSSPAGTCTQPTAADINQLILSQLDLGSTFGVAYLAVPISAILYGVTVTQTFYYYRSSKASSDPWYMKLLVAILLVLDSGHQALIIYSLYYYLIAHYAYAPALLYNVRTLSAEVLLTASPGPITFIVESFLTVRVWRLGRNIYLSGTIGVFVVAHLILNLIFAAKAFEFTELTGIFKLEAIGAACLAVATVADIGIAGSVLWYLGKSRTGFRRSDDIITRLMLLTISTGALTTIFVLADLVAFVAAPKTLWSIAFNFLLPKLYINTFLTTLNIRGTLRQGNVPTSSTGAFNSVPLRALERHGGGTHGGGHPIELPRGVDMARSVQVEVFSDKGLLMNTGSSDSKYSQEASQDKGMYGKRALGQLRTTDTVVDD
ncbi:hypothetical protein PsYK624_050180 [Phanerochaete sordida]|uniref:DUF6534 domain-containing protein n=1 Tax=Phanerochaete sordida TaxID=48140 RepID=A0A9P3LB72_9APHY|nr:hypothetical protein PsYK624_050180 [Phanerochaete sordida]